MAMPFDRRRFILAAGLSVTGGALAPSVARALAGSLLNTPEEVDRAVRTLRELGAVS